MKQFFTVLQFELSQCLKNKAFIIVTVIGVVLIGLCTSIPTFMNLGGSSDTADPGASDSQAAPPSDDAQAGGEEILIVDKTGYFADASVFTTGLSSEYTYRIEADPGEAALKDRINAGEFKAAIRIEALDSITLYQESAGLSASALSGQVSSFFDMMNKTFQLEAHGISPEQSLSILTSPVSVNVVETGKSFVATYLISYVMIFLLYMSVLLYGQLVATSVAGEKSNRAMEMLITSAKPTALMLGKVIASCLAGLIQLGVLILAAVGFYFLNAEALTSFSFVEEIFRQSSSNIIYLLIFYMLGFFSYGCLYGAVGSLASRTEDINTTSMPLILMAVVALFVSFTCMSAPESSLCVVTSFIPFISPMTMFIRICMTSVPFYQILLSILCNVAAILVFGWISAKIYRLGVLMYGKPPKMNEIIKMLREK